MSVGRSPLKSTTATQRIELLAGAIRDARSQLANTRQATRVAGGDPDYAERRWRMECPGLAALIDHAEGK